MKTLVTSLFLILCLGHLSSAFGQNFPQHSYYPHKFLVGIQSGTLQNDDLKNELYTVLTSEHQRTANGRDTLGCTQSDNCYEHQVLGYDGARKILFGKIHLKQSQQGYFIQDVYCKKIFTSKNAHVGPMTIPANEKINCEHTWPQSKFNRSFDKETQKSDLHHLYPTDSHANSVRGNFNFSEIAEDNGSLNDCDASRSGSSNFDHGGDQFFEPPAEHKGNVARALFYFSVRYQIAIDNKEEVVLRKWHAEDPVDEEEKNRNEIIYQAQKNRNPFIDIPQLTNGISNF